MTYLYVITRAITFFGTELRTFWEQLACRISLLAAEDIRAFKFGELCGHVEHELCRTKKQAFTVCFLPFAFNYVIGCCLLLSGAYSVLYVGILSSLKNWLFLYVGISCLANCVPSFEDVLSFKDIFYVKGSNVILKIVLAPFFATIYAFSILERYSLTFVLSIVFAFLFPHIFNLLFPTIISTVQMLTA